jgi:hypothetical protein
MISRSRIFCFIVPSSSFSRMRTKAETTYPRPPLQDHPSLRWRRWLDRWPIAAWVVVALIVVAFKRGVRPVGFTQTSS